jgi:hypothetical protein
MKGKYIVFNPERGGLEDMECIHSARDGDQWQALMHTVIIVIIYLFKLQMGFYPVTVMSPQVS